MEFLQSLGLQSWQWIADNGLSIIGLLILLILIPRIRRFVLAVATRVSSADGEELKGQRALLGAIVYIIEVMAYFVVVLAILSKLGISLTAAAIPATVISAAVGFGAQGVIGDLLGGVFIIAEKQYGIGDWVEFHSPSGTVQGEVSHMTLRATTIRTLNGEEVVIPNAEARMCINYSSMWSRAVVEVPVPMTAGGSIKDLEERTMAAANRAIALDDVRDSVLSDIKLQSSTALNAPTAMGLPWTVTMRLVVDCSPGDQWLIERAIRAAIIDTWWDDYGERASHSAFGPAEQVTGHVRDSSMMSEIEAAEKAAAERATNVEQAKSSRADAAGGVTDRNARSDIPAAGAALDKASQSSTSTDADEENEQPTTNTPWKEMSQRERLRTILSAGGRARVSTVILLVVLLLVGLLNILTIDPEKGPSGWLAPSRFSVEQNDEPEKTTSESPAATTQQENQQNQRSETTQPIQTEQQQNAPQNDQNGQSGDNNSIQTSRDEPTRSNSGTATSSSTTSRNNRESTAPTTNSNEEPTQIQ